MLVALRRIGVFLIALMFAQNVNAVGDWLELTPIGGVEIDEVAGDARLVLEVRLDAIERECSGMQTIVVRTKSLAAVFDHVRLAVNTNDLFVHWHPDSLVLSKRSFRRIGAFDAATPARRRAVPSANGGAFWHQPGCLINGRIGNGLGDYVTPTDNALAKDTRPDKLYEMVGTMNDSWGYHPTDTKYKSVEEIASLREKSRSIGSNYMLNIGPDHLGRIPAPGVAILEGLAAQNGGSRPV